jgi:hypothetical protein
MVIAVALSAAAYQTTDATAISDTTNDSEETKLRLIDSGMIAFPFPPHGGTN